jgi:hypothetical protein
MASVLELQALSPVGDSGLAAKSTVSIYRCGKENASSISVAWCGTNLIG